MKSRAENRGLYGRREEGKGLRRENIEVVSERETYYGNSMDWSFVVVSLK